MKMRFSGSRRGSPVWLAALAAAGLWSSIALCQSPSSYEQLQEIQAQIRALDLDEMQDLQNAAFTARLASLDGLRDRLSALDPSQWEIPRKVDYLLVYSQLAQLYFEHAALRPWRRDPGFYLDRVSRIPFLELPLPENELEALKTRLGSVVGTLVQARENLTEGASELAQLALHNLEKADGVGHGQPRRPVPPAGVIGWYEDLHQRVQQQHPELAPRVQACLTALRGYRDWLRENLASMSGPSGVGPEQYRWYLHNVRLLPFDPDEVVVLGERDLQRSLSLLAVQRWRNRHLPPLSPAEDESEYERRIAEADRLVRRFLVKNEILTIPAEVGQFGHNVPWIVREGGKRNFWEEVQFRDPLPDHLHAVIPGHRFDAWMHQRDRHPIRSSSSDSGRIEGWGFYLEEMLMQSGLLDERPRTKELFYIFQAARAVRNRVEVSLHSNRWSVSQAVRYMVETVPFMDEDAARVDCEIYLRQPGYGIGYVMGRLQIEQLLADRQQQLGDRFDLRAFHDQFLAAGWIPISLIRWEMTGLDDQAKVFWKVTRP